MKHPAWLPVLLGFLTAVGPVSTDMYLPAFAAIEAEFGRPTGSATVTLATWFAGLALGQVTQGALSDRFGRRGPLIAGTALYTAASVGCALAGSMGTLSAWRLVAALGGSASMVVPRAIVRDLVDGPAAARMMARLILVMGAAPILAPTLGGAILGFASWRTIFWISAAYGAVCCVLVWVLLPDTLARDMRIGLGPAGLLTRYAAILRDRAFLAHALMGAFGMFAMFAYLGGSPPVYIGVFGISPRQYGTIFGLCAAGFIAGAQISPRLLPRFGADAILRGAALVFLLTTAVLMAVALARVQSLAAIVAPVFVALATLGFVMPNATVGALSRHAPQAASASALMGTIQFVIGAISGLLAGWLADGTARGMALLMLLGAIGLFAADRLRPRAAPPKPHRT
jgi:DHA1 family bicyclomycin/chloramphenicol resistance-like MFS transporter